MSKTIEDESDGLTEIQQAIGQIFHTFDNKEWEKCRSLFLNEVELNISSPNGGKAGKYFADDLINQLKMNLSEKRKTYRTIGQQTFEINNNMASVFSRKYVFHRLEDCEEQEFWEIWGSYTHFFVKTENGWKCSGIKLLINSQSENFDVFVFVPEKEIQ